MIQLDEKTLADLTKNCKTQEDLFGENGLIKLLVKRALENVLEHEMTSHLGYDKHSISGSNTGNSRNGHSSKTIRTDSGNVNLTIPRDRNGDFAAKIITKNSKTIGKLDKQVISLYAKGLSTRDIQEQLEDIYGTEVSPQFISNVTDGVMDDVVAWRNRPLDPIYPIIYMDCIVVKIKENKQITSHAIYFALGVNMEGQKELLGMWVSPNEGAKFWLHVLTELKTRGVEDILIACVDGLTGFPEAIEAAYPKTTVQLCIVHLIRNSLKFVSHKEKKSIAADLKKIYSAVNLEEAEMELKNFKEKHDDRYPSISDIWTRNWSEIIPFLQYPKDIRKAVYTTNAIESVNSSLRKIIKNRQLFPNDLAIKKILYLALRNISKKWSMPIHNWKSALNQFAIIFADRFPERF